MDLTNTSMGDEQKSEQPTEYKLLIEFVYQKKSRLWRRTKYLVQNRPFKFGLRIKNIDSKPTPKGKIKNMTLESAEGGGISHRMAEEFAIQELNPGQEITLWWPNFLTTPIRGQSWVGCDVEPDDTQKTRFTTYQFDPVCDTKEKHSTRNSWGYALTVRGELEQQQARSNFLVFVLTLLVFLDGVFGLDEIVKFIISVLGSLLVELGTIFSEWGIQKPE